jgi:hypothetical protein
MFKDELGGLTRLYVCRRQLTFYADLPSRQIKAMLFYKPPRARLLPSRFRAMARLGRSFTSYDRACA